LIRAVVAGHDGHVVFARAALRFDLVAHRGDRFRRRADEDEAGVAHGAREGRAFGEKTVARMDGVGAQLFAAPITRATLEVRFACGAGPMQTASSMNSDDTPWRRLRNRCRAGRCRLSRAARAMRTAISPRLAIRRRIGEAASLHPRGRRFSRNARRPSCPSALVRCAAIACAVVSSVASYVSRCYARERALWSRRRRSGSRCDFGRHARDRGVEIVFVATTSWTRPIASARARVEAFARERERARVRRPIFASTKGEITAGMMPSLVSVKPKTVSAAAIATSHTRDEAGAAAECGAVDAADHRFSSVSIARNMRDIARASSRFASRVSSSDARIH
jgi:hypothetical protein